MNTKKLRYKDKKIKKWSMSRVGAFSPSVDTISVWRYPLLVDVNREGYQEEVKKVVREYYTKNYYHSKQTLRGGKKWIKNIYARKTRKAGKEISHHYLRDEELLAERVKEGYFTGILWDIW